MRKGLTSILLFLSITVAAQVTGRYPFEITGGMDYTDLISWWSFDEASGNLIDLHTTGDDGVVTNSGSAIYGATGKINDAYDFERSGETDYVTLGAGVAVGTGDFSVTCWMNLETLDDDYALCGGPAGAFTLRVNSGGGLSVGMAWGTYTTITTMVATTGSLFFVGAAYDQTANTVTFRLNGSTEVETFSVEMSATTNYIGSQETGDWSFDGVIDEMNWWSVELSTAQFNELYNSGNGKGY